MKESILCAKNGKDNFLMILKFTNDLPEAWFSLRLLKNLSMGEGFGLLDVIKHLEISGPIVWTEVLRRMFRECISV